MSFEGWHILAMILFALAIVFAVLAIISYKVLHIREVRNTLTGRTQEREIALLRNSRHELWRPSERPYEESLSASSDISLMDFDESQTQITNSSLTTIPQLDESETIIPDSRDDESETVIPSIRQPDTRQQAQKSSAEQAVPQEG